MPGSGRAFYHTTIDGLAPGEELPSDEILALDDALTRLGAQAPRLQTVVEFRYFSGLTDAEIGRYTLGVSERTVHRDWLKARAWLYKVYPVSMNTDPRWNRLGEYLRPGPRAARGGKG